MNELVEWPDISRKIYSAVSDPASSADSFFSWLISFDGLLENAVADLQHAFIASQTDVELLIASWCNGNTQDTDYEFIAPLLCAKILNLYPDIQTWEKVRSLAANSAVVEYGLRNAMLALCKQNSDVEEIYVQLITSVFNAIECGKLTPSFHRQRNDNANRLSAWANTREKLEQVWRGIHLADPTGFQEAELFALLADIDFEKLIALLNSSENPFLLDSILMVSGAGMFTPRLERWKRLAASAAPAFSDEGEWNENIFLPLLLSHVMSRLQELPHQLLKREKVPEEIFRAELEALTEIIAKTLSVRPDYAGIVTRWSAWLTRQILLDERGCEDLYRPSFAYSLLNDALGRKASAISLPDSSPPQAPAWEVLSYYAARSNYAHDNSYPLQDVTIFNRLWRPESSEISKVALDQFSSRLSMFYRREGQPFPGLASHLFAFPLVQQGNTAEEWLALWNSAYLIREVAEFGFADSPSEKYTLRHQVGEMLLVLCTTGIAALDQLAGLFTEGQQRYQQDVIDLHQHLYDAVTEMMTIDDTINTKYWKEAYLHLCLRRAIWDKSLGDASTESLFVPSEYPTFNQYLHYYRSDLKDLIAMLSSCMRNNISPVALKAVLLESDIELSQIIDHIKKLNGIDGQRYPLNQKEIADLHPLL
ncbi:hypothetical protein FMM65_23920 [Citrobacter youngae]|nr:hypothetical protein FMM65_23920 [Citrobacter youngae]